MLVYQSSENKDWEEFLPRLLNQLAEHHAFRDYDILWPGRDEWNAMEGKQDKILSSLRGGGGVFLES